MPPPPTRRKRLPRTSRFGAADRTACIACIQRAPAGPCWPKSRQRHSSEPTNLGGGAVVIIFDAGLGHFRHFRFVQDRSTPLHGVRSSSKRETPSANKILISRLVKEIASDGRVGRRAGERDGRKFLERKERKRWDFYPRQSERGDGNGGRETHHGMGREPRFSREGGLLRCRLPSLSKWG